MASQHDTGNGGRWQVSDGKLQMAAAETGWMFKDVPFKVTYNSNGAPILVSNGKEYMRCE